MSRGYIVAAAEGRGVEKAVTRVTGSGQRREPGDIPNYQLLGFIDAGGFGDVWLARERVTGVRRAIKVLHKADAGRVSRDIQGVRDYQCCTHNHPHLLQILTVGETERCFYYVMEAADNGLVAGADEYEPSTLRTWLQARGRCGGRSALELLQKLAGAVSRLHEQGLAHYDLKPENILIVEGEPKIADVGLVAPMDQPPAHAGTPLYMTPEGQANDLYALGKILYELIAGRPATDFPRLPLELVQHPQPELTAAVQIADRACHNAPARRFSSVAELERSVAGALRTQRSLPARWRGLSRTSQALVGVVCASATVLLVFVGDAIHARIIPRVHWQDQIPLSTERWSFVDPKPSRAALHPYLSFAGAPSKPGAYVYELAHPLENFFLEARFVSRRPWGAAEIALASTPDEKTAVRAHLQGQPNGTGLHVMLDIGGLPLDPAASIWGHPLPGVEYVLRLTRLGDRVALALWPLARDSHQPLQAVRDLPPGEDAARYVILEGSTADALAEFELHELRVTEYSVPLQHGDYPLSDELSRGVQAAWLPEIPADAQTPAGNLLAGPFHPYDSDAWMSVGHWSWWEDAAPGSTPKRIHCVPCSSQMRRELQTRAGGSFDGIQLLRFDRARYGDFVARLRVHLVPVEMTADEPFPSASESGVVGLAFRLQDTPPAGAAWGGGYSATVTLDPSAPGAAVARLRRSEGFGLNLGHECAIAAVDLPGLPPAEQTVPVDRAVLLAREGFTLGVRAVGSHFSMTINGQAVADVDDPGGFTTGRIALIASRLIATFESLEVTPLD